MATRTDSKGRILRRGEGQKPDGRYYFKYTDARGKTRYKYSWTLTERDIPPKGKSPAPVFVTSRSKFYVIVSTT